VARKLEKKVENLENEIKKREAAQDALSEREVQYRTIFESVSEGLLIFDASGRLVDANPAACRLYGYKRQQMLDLVDWERLFAGSETLARMPLSQLDGPLSAEVVQKTKDGSLAPVSVQATTITLRDERHVLAVVLDLSEKKQLEEQLRHAQRMEVIGHIAGGIAHDFKNLLQIILMQCELGIMTAAPGDPLHSNLDMVQSTARRATKLAHQLLDFSRRGTTERAIIDLDQVVAGLECLLGWLSGPEVVLEFHAGVGEHVVDANVSQVEQILFNLCINAREAMPGGGRLVIRTDRLELSGDAIRREERLEPGDYVELRVEDTGCGMDAATVSRIFEPFFTTKPNGTGFGLATVLHIANRHGGTVRCTSERGSGTVFSVLLPAITSQGEMRMP
jgi:PAS domain S-box-containing protein